MDTMLDLTRHLPPSKSIGSLRMSERAATQIGKALTAYDESGDAEKFGPAIAASITSILSSDYFKHSEWFRRQSIHSVVAFAVRPHQGADPIYVHRVLLAKGEAGYTVLATDEAALPDNYFDERVIEEVKVEEGIDL
jgi:hypothetical protein